MRNTLFGILFLFILPLQAHQKLPYLQKQGSTTQLMVDGKPFLVIGGELGNSSASSIEDIERIFPKLQRMGLNTVLVPAYWDLTEPQEGKFDFTLTDKVIQQARANDLKVVFLWFGAWKNSMSCYAPIWFKEDYKKYPRAYTKAGKPLEIASSFSENVFQADSRAFSQWMKHIASVDKEEGTVIMIQIENEIGMLEDARDYSKEADKLFYAPVPSLFIGYLQKNKRSLHPEMLAKWESQGFKKKGTWQEVFGADVYTDEIFMAWPYAQYVERMAKLARSIYNIPLYVNAAMNSRGRKPGEYPSAGPLAHLIDVWHYAAPNIDFLAPDLYDKGFVDWVAKYKLHNNPLFIPEIRLEDNDGVRAFYVFGADVYTDEIFMAWSYAQYVERMAKLARSIYNIPLYVNAAMNSRGRKPGEYPSAGPLAHLIDVWHYAAPNIDFLAPDLYDKGFVDWVAKYKLHNNPLFIPEIRLEDNDGVRAFYVFGEHDAIGFCPFSIESGSDRADAPLVQSYIKLKELMPLLTKYQGKGVMNGLLFDEENKERILSYDDLEITCRHYFTLPWDPRARDGTVWPEGGGVLLRLAPDEYIVAGSGLVLEFKKQGENKMKSSPALGEDGFASVGGKASKTENSWQGGMRAGIGSVDEVNVNEDGSLKYIRRLNGDQDHQGRHVRIPVGEFSILHVKLYEYK